MDISVLSLWGVIIGGIFLIQSLFFVIAAGWRTDKVTDIAYGTTFVAATIFLYVHISVHDIPHAMIALAVVLWGIRLAGYLFIRILKWGTDKRFDDMRNKVWSFAKFRLLQAIVISVVLSPVVFAMSNPLNVYVYLPIILGMIVFGVGFLIETVADYQKYFYKKQKPQHRVDQGLWRYARHPNYFGEILVWLGIFIMCSPYLTGRSRIAIVSPLSIILLLVYVSGVPLLEASWEKRYGDDPSWIRYKTSTHLLVPLPMFHKKRLITK